MGSLRKQPPRALGCRFHSEDRTLRLFDRFLVDHDITMIDDITTDTIDRFLTSRPRRAPKGYNHLLGVVRRLFDWLVSQQVIAVSPVQARSRPETARRLPFLFNPPLARQLLDVARQLPDNNRSRYRGPTYHAIFALPEMRFLDRTEIATLFVQLPRQGRQALRDHALF